MDAKAINILIGIGAGILTILFYAVGIFGWILKNIKLLIKPDDSILRIPQKTIVLLKDPTPQNIWWHMGSVGNEPAMQISGHFLVTNISKYNILITSAKMRRPHIIGNAYCRATGGDIYGSYFIPSGETTDLSFDFWIVPPVKKKREEFKADIAILDQFGNEHWVKDVTFRYS